MKVCARDWTKAHAQTNAMIFLVEAATGGSPCKPTKSAFGKRGWSEGPVAIGFFWIYNSQLTGAQKIWSLNFGLRFLKGRQINVIRHRMIIKNQIVYKINLRKRNAAQGMERFVWAPLSRGSFFPAIKSEPREPDPWLKKLPEIFRFFQSWDAPKKN